jgi:hypothetical protein
MHDRRAADFVHNLLPEIVLQRLLYGAMFVVTVSLLLRPVNDPDFFWHLKTGDWIWQHRELPAQDPFNHTSGDGTTAGQRFTLTASWLSQVLFHVSYDLGGMPGIVALKLLLGLLLAAVLIKLRRGDPLVFAALVPIALLLICRVYPFDRPHVFSFIFFAALLFLLEKERASATAPAAWASLLPVPLLMLLWANMHGGHAFGQVTIVLFIALEGLKFAHRALRPVRPDQYRRLVLVGVGGLAASCVNPNSYHALGIALAPAPVWLQNTEYVSTVTFFRQQPLVVIFWGALVLAAAYCLATVRKPDITLFALLAGTGSYGFQHVRYVPFFMILALPAISQLLSAERVRWWGRYVLAAASIALVASVVTNDVPSRTRIEAAMRVNEAIYPVRAADFVIANGIRGKLYNTYAWGGYLIWRLGPGSKVFVDGRGLSAQANFESVYINTGMAVPGQYPPLWKKLLQQRGVDFMVIPRTKGCQSIVNTFDETEKLRRLLLASPEWVPVFADPISLVFVLNAPQHREVINRYAIPRERLLG